MNKKNYTRQARLPRDAYAKSLEEITAEYRKKADEERLRKNKKKLGLL